jgi:lipopolysaccharide biosynthesis protein
VEQILYKNSMIAVFIHLFYQDLWSELQRSLCNLKNVKFDLYVTICSDHDNSIILTIKKDFPNAIILSVPNRGADVGPFFEKLNYCFNNKKKYEWILKIHSKKSLLVSPKNGELWRKSNYSTLMPSDFSKISSSFKNSKIGMIGAAAHLISKSSNDLKSGKNVNLENINYFRNKLKISDSELNFFAGTMFWIKYSILQETFFNNKLTVNDFGEGHAPDGTRAHAMERVFANIVRDKKYKLLAIR